MSPSPMVPADSSRLAYWVDAFTDRAFGGNPAVVIPDATGLSDELMQQIAREVNCSETAFVLPANDPAADLRLRWFTPTLEVDLCGHATVAALHALAAEGQFNLKPGHHQILYIETRSGTLKVSVDYPQDARPWIWLTLPPCTLKAIEAEPVRLLQQALGITGNLPLQPVQDSLNQDVLVMIPKLTQLQDLKPNFAALAHLGQRQGWRGCCVCTTETLAPEHAAHLRFFAPQSGIPEDPVTGSVSGPLATWLHAEALLPIQETPYCLEQGFALNRPGQILVQLMPQGTRLGGRAVTVLKGDLYL